MPIAGLREVYFHGEILSDGSRKQIFEKVFPPKTAFCATVSCGKSALVCRIIGWGFGCKGTAGEKAFFWRGKWFSSEEEKLFSGATMGDWDRGGVPS